MCTWGWSSKRGTKDVTQPVHKAFLRSTWSLVTFMCCVTAAFREIGDRMRGLIKQRDAADAKLFTEVRVWVDRWGMQPWS